MSAQDDRLLCLFDQLHRIIQRRTRRVHHRLVTRQFYLCGIFEFAGLDLRILANIDQHRTRTPTAGNVERLADGSSDLICAGDEIVVFGDGQRDARHIGFLKRVTADEMRRHLPGDENHRNRVHHRSGDARHQIRRTGTGCRHRHTDLPRSARESIRHVRPTLLMPNQHMMDGIAQHGIIDRHIRTAGISKHHFHTLTHQTFPNNFCTSLFHSISLNFDHGR